MKKRIPLALATLALSALLAASALAAGALHLATSSNPTLGKTVLVNPAGRTLYTLSDESSGHLLCTSKQCLALWPPLTVGSKTAKVTMPSSVHGKLGTVKRADGAWQVTLGGRPVYRYHGDTAAGQAHGEGLRLAGGVWHAVTAAGATPAPVMQPTAPSMPSEAPASPYGY